MWAVYRARSGRPTRGWGTEQSWRSSPTWESRGTRTFFHWAKTQGSAGSARNAGRSVDSKARVLVEGALVEPCEQLGDGAVEFGQREEGAVA